MQIIPYRDTIFPSWYPAIRKSGSIVLKSSNNTLYWYGGNKWNFLDTASLSNRIDQRTKYTDTAAMLVPYARNASPTFTGTVTADNITAKQYYSPIQTLTDGTTITWNANTSDQAIVTLSGTGRTLSITNPIAGSFYTLKIIQGNPVGGTISTWPTNTKWPGGTLPTLTTASNAVDIISFWYDGTNYNAAYELDVK